MARRLILAWSMVVTLLFVIGCGGGESATSVPPTTPPQQAATSAPVATGTQAQATPTQVATPTATKAAAPTVSDIQGELVLVISGLGLQIMNPAKETRAGGATYQVPMWDNLLGYDYETGGTSPGIAETWEQSPDGLDWTFTLRNGLKWHNGDPITTADIAFSVAYYQSEEATTGGGPFEVYEVETTVHDERRITFRTNQNNIFFAGELSPSGGGQQMMLPKKYIEQVGSEEFGKKPIGSGPWKFVKSEPGILVQFEAWREPHWRGTPNFQLHTLRAVPEESTRMAMLRTGAAGIANIEPQSFDETKAAGLKLVSATGANQSTYVIEGTYAPEHANSPLADVRVREALSLAINRQEIVDFIMEGAAAVPLPYGVWKYSQDIDVDYWEKWSEEKFGYDPKRAKELLAEAGYANGLSFPYWLVSSPGTPWQIQVGEAMIGYWKAVGINPEVRQVEWGVFSPKRRQFNPETGVPRELGGTIKNSRSAGRPNTGTRILGELGDCNLFTPKDDPPGGGSAGSFQIQTEACREIYRLWYDSKTGVLNETDAAKRRVMFPPAIEYAASLWIAVPVIEGSVNYAVDPKVVGKFSVPSGSGELGNMSSSIPRANQKSW